MQTGVRVIELALGLGLRLICTHVNKIHCAITIVVQYSAK